MIADFPFIGLYIFQKNTYESFFSDKEFWVSTVVKFWSMLLFAQQV